MSYDITIANFELVHRSVFAKQSPNKYIYELLSRAEKRFFRDNLAPKADKHGLSSLLSLSLPTIISHLFRFYRVHSRIC